jgi:hypothetical protein
MSILSKAQLLSNISSELADNNAGSISAYNVRHNLQDVVDSINQVVASGDFDATTPFTGGNVRAKIVSNQYGLFIAESGINFPNGGGTQYVPYPGPNNISHNTLSNLAAGDPHTQYLPVDGTRVAQNNIGFKDNWINASGNSSISTSTNRGLKFETTSPTQEKVHVGTGTKFTFDVDGSNLSTGKATARAWINFNSSGTPLVVRDSYNVSGIQKLATGKFKIIFVSGALANNNYVAIGTSNARSSAASAEDFDVNTVGIVSRVGDDASALRSLTFCVLNDGDQFVDAQLNDLVIFGLEKGTSTGTSPTIL